MYRSDDNNNLFCLFFFFKIKIKAKLSFVLWLLLNRVNKKMKEYILTELFEALKE